EYVKSRRSRIARHRTTRDVEPRMPPVAADDTDFAPPGVVLALWTSPSGRRFVTAQWDGDVRLWDTDTNRPLGEPLRHTGTVHHLAFTADDKLFVTVDDNTPPSQPFQGDQSARLGCHEQPAGAATVGRVARRAAHRRRAGRQDTAAGGRARSMALR